MLVRMKFRHGLTRRLTKRVVLRQLIREELSADGGSELAQERFVALAPRALCDHARGGGRPFFSLLSRLFRCANRCGEGGMTVSQTSDGQCGILSRVGGDGCCERFGLGGGGRGTRGAWTGCARVRHGHRGGGRGRTHARTSASLRWCGSQGCEAAVPRRRSLSDRGRRRRR
jgi:hypothetical protein